MPETEGERARRIYQTLLTACLGGVTRSEEALEAVATEASHLKRRPTHLATPRTEDDVVGLMKAANKNELRLTARGAGTSMAGQSIGRGVIVDFSRRMRRIQDPDEKNGTITAQPGAVLDSLQTRLEETPWTVWPDPSSRDRATLGGMAANNASGIHGLGYGATLDNVTAMRVALLDGRLVDTVDPATLEKPPFPEVERQLRDNLDLLQRIAPKVAKNASGYRFLEAMQGDRLDPTKLFIGSEGTLGLTTEITWRLHPKPQGSALLAAGFPSTDRAVQALAGLLELEPAALELVDEMALTLLRKARPEATQRFPDSVQSLLLVEFHATQTQDASEKIEPAQAVADAAGAADQQTATTPEDAEALWAARRGMQPLLEEADPEKVAGGTMEDPVVPVDQVGALVSGVQEIFRSHGWQGATYGHAGQGNLHCRPLIDPKSREDRAGLREAEEAFYQLVKRLGGSPTGEHGDGSMRTRWTELFWGEALPVIREVKRLFDPKRYLNPGVKVPF